jgi:hypothetical protein
MSPPAKLYCIDTCSLIERNARGKYPHEVFPSLWERVDGLIRSGRLFSSEEVLSEIKKCTDTSDATHLWAVANSSIFLPIDDDVQNECLRIQGEFPRLVDPNGTKSQGDPWVIATAAKYSYVVVTEEEKPILPHLRSTPQDIAKTKAHPTRLKSPDVCRCIGVDCINLIGLMRHERWTF